MNDQIKEFFDKHPGIDEVHEALGYLFISPDEADRFCAGTSEKPVKHDRNAITVPDDAGKADVEMQTEFVEQIVQDTTPTIVHDDATTYGKSHEEVAQIKKVKAPKKESAKKAAAKGKPTGK